MSHRHQHDDKRPRRHCYLFWKSPHIFNPLVHTPFKVDGIEYMCVDQYVLCHKALMFNDPETHDKARIATTGKDFRELSKTIKNYDHSIWLRKRLGVMTDANYYKFSQNPELRTKLFLTEDDVIVFANPYDTVWGVGMDENDRNVVYRDRWRGDNLLGEALMRVRDELQGRGEAGDL
jgi:ribA/ribD-fused uncharacterized protein